MIYYVLAKGTRRVKIGYTNGEVASRISQLATGCPYELYLLASHEGDQDAEKILHQMFDADRLNGEWFNLSEPLHAHIVRLLLMCCQFSDFDYAPLPAHYRAIEVIFQDLPGDGSDDFRMGFVLWQYELERTYSDSTQMENGFCATKGDHLQQLQLALDLPEGKGHWLIRMRSVWNAPLAIDEATMREMAQRLTSSSHHPPRRLMQ